ncbi:erythrocyte band 7 integral membrane protein-like [Thalassophryne amazonica]|uniref:erythrocyte band 7 integral membrane protein-like n=1 Tax=Thalassophryne amazonica TaxID=390379 RepID=UPI0014724026|nr:erythrocyte band 7 integral membrane protein-like [Thalassophryne amazonica]
MEEERQRRHQTVSETPDGSMSWWDWLLLLLSYLLLLITLPVSIWRCLKIIHKYESGVVIRLGHILPKAKGPGLVFVLPCTDRLIRVDIRTVVFTLQQQEVLTKDFVTMRVHSVVYYRVKDATKAVTNVTDVDDVMEILAQSTITTILGTKTVSEILSQWDQIRDQIQCTLDDAADISGVQVEQLQIKTLNVKDQQLQKIVAAKVIAAEGEIRASQMLKEASVELGDSPSALRLRYLQTMEMFAAEKSVSIQMDPEMMHHSLTY